MDCDALRDDQWDRIKGFVPGGTKGKRGPRTDNRKFLDALLWMARSGGRWRDLPERLGDYRSVKGAIIAGSRWAFSMRCYWCWREKPIWSG